MENENVLTAEEVARILRIAKNTVYKLVERGELRAYRVGKKFRFDRADVDAYRSAMKGSVASEARPLESTIPAERAPAERRQDAHALHAEYVERRDDGRLHSFILAGQDILLDILARMLEERTEGLRVYRSSLGSYNGLFALYQGKVHAATAHLWDGSTDTYNLPYVRYMMPGSKSVVIRLARRTVGYYVAAGNPKGLSSWEDLRRADLSMVNRERGSGIRVLLDERLRIMGLDPWALPGYERETTAHLSAASIVARGGADFALGNEKAGRQARGIEFIPLQEECYDLVIRAEDAGMPGFPQLLEIVASREFKDELEGLGGYGLGETGRTISS